MKKKIISEVLNVTCAYLSQKYSNEDASIIFHEIEILLGMKRVEKIESEKNYSYDEVQMILSSMNENESSKKNKGVYYTPVDVVKFILLNSIKLSYNKLTPSNLHVMDTNGIPYLKLCLKKTIYDPTCGAGEFLLAALEMKLDLMDMHNKNITKTTLQKIVATIKGNDINNDSVLIAKLRLFLCILHRTSAMYIYGMANVINSSFFNYDYVCIRKNNKYDIIIGNPPYVEDSKSGLNQSEKYGNIYANVLENSTFQLNDNGVIGFVVPLSYIATPRMSKLRTRLFDIVPYQYILSYSDRPDCLFNSVHQKLCILIAKKSINMSIYTSNYKYWYSNERMELFNNSKVTKNHFVTEKYIPKIGNCFDSQIYKKVINYEDKLLDLMQKGNSLIYINMRATFWIKAFQNKHSGSEYKIFRCEDYNYASLCFCILNSSLFWWYWICVSDCWHITNKELIGFSVPKLKNLSVVLKLAKDLENKLEETKLYVGTKQVDYEYKHKECINELRLIDDYINDIYNLSETEKLYINNFAKRYRLGGNVSG